MNQTDQESSGEMNFYERYSDFTDDQLFEIVKNRRNYQDKAADAAVRIALERGLIHSEQDLLGPEFQKRKTSGFTVFPEITNDFHRQKLTGSLFRYLYVLSFLPLIYAFLNYGEGKYNLTYLGAGISLVWFLLSLLLKKTRKQVVFIPLLLVLFSVSAFAGIGIFSSKPIVFLDVVMLLTGTLLSLYLILFLKNLMRQKSEQA